MCSELKLRVLSDLALLRAASTLSLVVVALWVLGVQGGGAGVVPWASCAA